MPLKTLLDRLYADYNEIESVRDPVHIVRQFDDPADREVVGFCAAALAFGRVASLMDSIERLLEVMRPRPADFVRRFEPRTHKPILAGIGHRWIRRDDVVALLWILRRMLEQSGSLEQFFVERDDPATPDVFAGLEQFAGRACDIDLRPAYGSVPPRPGVQYFFPRPSRGSACKRLNLFLRWMVRRDAIDLGVWTRVSPARLVVPLDTHVIRVGQCLRLTRYRSAGWRMAADITESLREIDPLDPVKYDFALCHLGMRNACGFNRPQKDDACPLRGYCRPRPRRLSGSRAPSSPR